MPAAKKTQNITNRLLELWIQKTPTPPENKAWKDWYRKIGQKCSCQTWITPRSPWEWGAKQKRNKMVGRQVRSGLEVWSKHPTYLKFLYFVVYVLTCDKGKEWVAMPSWNFAWAWRCQEAKELVFVLLTNDHLPGCFLCKTDRSKQWSRNFLFVWLRSLILHSHNQSQFFSKCHLSLTKGCKTKIDPSFKRARLISWSLICFSLHFMDNWTVFFCVL